MQLRHEMWVWFGQSYEDKGYIENCRINKVFLGKSHKNHLLCDKPVSINYSWISYRCDTTTVVNIIRQPIHIANL